MYYLGVEGGGTKTTAVLLNSVSGKIQSLREGPGNIAVLDRGSVAALVHRVLTGFDDTPNPAQIRQAVMAFAGFGRAYARNALREILHATGIQNFELKTDAEILRESFFGDEAGILISAGTGTVCLIRTPSGESRQLSGHGYLFGDNGSGFDIGRRAIQYAIRDDEMNQEPGSLAQILLQFYGISSPRDLLNEVYESANPANMMASCARIVCAAADRGDEVAHKIIVEAAESLYQLLTRALQHFDFLPVRVGLAGGVLSEGTIVRRKFVEIAVREKEPVDYVAQKVTPAVAALIRALNNSGETVSSKLMHRLEKISFHS